MFKTILLFFALIVSGVQLWAQAVAVPMPFVKSTFLDGNGKPCNGCLVWTYVAGTTTVQDSYTTTAGNVANTNPVVLNASGQADIFLGVATYKIVFETAPLPAQSHGSVLWTEDNILGSTSNSLTEYTAPYANSVPRTITSKLSDIVSALDFGVDNTGGTDATTALNHAVASGHPVYLPCGTYFTTASVVLASPGVGLIGENEGCVIWNFVGTTQPITWQMSPFTTAPAGIVANITINGTSSAKAGILTGHLVGGTFLNLAINGFSGSAPGAGIWAYNSGLVSDGWFERNTFQNVQFSPQGQNSFGLYLQADDSASSFGYNNFNFIGLNPSTGQVGIKLQSGYFNHNKLYAVCNLDNNAAGTVGPICIDSHSNWDTSDTVLLGEFQNSGSGTGTPYSVQVETSSRFANIGGAINVFAPGGSPLGFNNLAGNFAVPSVTMHQPSRPDWDTGTFNLGSLGALNLWTGFRDNGSGSCGLLEGANAGSILCTILSGSGNQFIVGGVNAGAALGTAAPLFSVDVAGSTVAQGNVTAGGAISATGGITGANITVTGLASAGALSTSGSATIGANITVTGGSALGGLVTQAGGNDDNDGSLVWGSTATTSNAYTMTGTYSRVICTGNMTNGSWPGVAVDTALVGGHWQVSLQATVAQSSGATGAYHCRLIP